MCGVYKRRICPGEGLSIYLEYLAEPVLPVERSNSQWLTLRHGVDTLFPLRLGWFCVEKRSIFLDVVFWGLVFSL